MDRVWRIGPRHGPFNSVWVGMIIFYFIKNSIYIYNLYSLFSTTQRVFNWLASFTFRLSPFLLVGVPCLSCGLGMWADPARHD
jgi:hypothetical protein